MGPPKRTHFAACVATMGWETGESKDGGIIVSVSILNQGKDNLEVENDSHEVLEKTCLFLWQWESMEPSSSEP